MAPVERPPWLPRVPLGVVPGPLVNMVNGEAPLRDERIKPLGLPVLDEQKLAVREAVCDLEHVRIVYNGAGRVDTRCHDGGGCDPVQLDAGPRTEHGRVHLRPVKAPADGHEAEGAQPCVGRLSLVAVHVGEPVHVGDGVGKDGRACRHGASCAKEDRSHHDVADLNALSRHNALRQLGHARPDAIFCPLGRNVHAAELGAVSRMDKLDGKGIKMSKTVYNATVLVTEN